MRHIVLSIIVFGNCIILTASAGKVSCPKHTFKNGDLCFEPHFERPSTFENANEICMDSDEQLAIISSEETEQFLGRLSLKLKNQIYWAGNGTKVLKMCQALNYGRNFEFYQEDCHQNIFYICEKDISKCPSSALKYGNKCFEISRNRQKYSNAKKACESKGGSLAEIDSPEKSHFIQKVLHDDDWWFKVSDNEIDSIGLSALEMWSGAIFDPIKQKWVSKNGNELIYMNGKLGKTSDDVDNFDVKCVHNRLHKSHIGDCEMHNFFFCQFPARVLANSNTKRHQDVDDTYTQSLIINENTNSQTLDKLTYGAIGVVIGVGLCLIVITLAYACFRMKSKRMILATKSKIQKQRSPTYYPNILDHSANNSPIYKGTTTKIDSQKQQLLDNQSV